MGRNESGELGDGAKQTRRSPVMVASNVASVSTGNNYTMFVKADGTLWATGSNDSGQLGDGTQDSRLTPVQVATDVRSVSAGYEHTMFIKRDGTLWAMGAKSAGSFGDGNDRNYARQVLKPIKILDGVASVSVGYGDAHTMLVKKDGTLWITGSNFKGQQGDGASTDRYAWRQVDSGVLSAYAGNGTSFYIKSDGTLWAAGLNESGQLGDGTKIDRHSFIRVNTGQP